MTSLLRQIVAGPRAKHAETGLDLCYVTSNIIVTSGPSQTYPQRAYRNPLDRLVTFLDSTHGEGWAIWEFRAEGTGYPDEAVYGRIRHYPWPDHHPPPFALVPMIMASMRNWLAGGTLDGGPAKDGDAKPISKDAAAETVKEDTQSKKKGERVIVVHCKAGKGRSGTSACSFLISECGWTAADALARFTERRMRPGFGAGVSIPSQLRWVGYVDRWTRGGKKAYVDREIEVVEVHVWGLRHGVKVCVEGYVDEGKKIRMFHTFAAHERIIVEGDAPGGAGVMDLVADMAGAAAVDEHGEVVEDGDASKVAGIKVGDGQNGKSPSKSESSFSSRATSILRSFSKRSNSRPKQPSTTSSTHSSSAESVGSPATNGKRGGRSKTIPLPPDIPHTSSPKPIEPWSPDPKRESESQSSLPLRSATTILASAAEPGGRAVIFKPGTPVRLPTSDVNISLERRNRAGPAAAASMMTVVTAVGHVWFNAYFEGGGPEDAQGRAADNGVFAIDWNAMDGIKGSSRKGTRACDRLSVVWRAVGSAGGAETGRGNQGETVVDEPPEGVPIPQMRPADWKGVGNEDQGIHKDLGQREADPDSDGVSRASSIQEEHDHAADVSKAKKDEAAAKKEDDEAMEGVKTSGPQGQEKLDDAHRGKGLRAMLGSKGSQE